MAIASWLTPASKSGMGNKTVGLTASKNPGASRTTIVTVTVSGITKTVNCTQTEQDKFTLKVSSTTLNSAETAITNIGECSIGSASNAGVATGTYYRDTSQTITAKAAPTGYNFIGWYEGSNLISSSLQVSVTMSANRTLVAKYQIKSYVVNAVSDDTTKGIVSPAGQTVEHGKNATVTANRKTGYKFDGWYNGNTKVTSTNPYTFAPTANITLTAKWAINTVSDTIKISPSGGGTVSPNPVTGQENTIISVTATPATGYNFKHWRYNDSSASGGYSESTTNPLRVTITGKRDITAVFELKSYTVTWNANGGTVSPASTTKTHGSTLGTLPTPTRASTAEYSYTFAGWFTATSGGTQISSTTTVTGNVTYYAHWTATKRSYTATFNGNGGSTPSPSSITKEYNTALGTLPTCTRTGYTFLGWYTASSGGTKISTTTVVTKDITYYAQWSINSYTLTFNPNGGTVTPTSKDLEYNSVYGTLPTPTRASNAQYTYTFAGWYTAATGGTQVTAATKMAAKDTTVYAHWTSNTRSYTVSYQTTYGTLNRTSQSIAYNSKGSCTLTMPNNTAEFTYTFVGWYTAANGGGTKVGSELTLETPAITGTVTYYAYVTRSTKSYTHTFNANGGGTVSPATITKAYNTALGTLPTVSRTGYTFVGWFDTSAASGGTQATTTTKVTGTKTWYARWSINSYTFTFNKNGGNTPSATTITKEYNTAIGTLPTCTRSADNTYTYAFAGWFDTSASSGGTQLTTSTKVTSNKTWYARWTPTYKNYTVTWNANGGTVSPASTTKTHGSTLGTLPTPTRASTAEYSYTFAGWFTATSGGTQISSTTTVTGNVTYYAHWTATKRSYTATFNGNGGSTPSPSSITKEYNTALGTLPTCTRTGYTFLGWYTASSGGTKISTTTVVTKDITYYAQWSINSYTLTFNPNGGTVTPTSKDLEYNSVYGTLPTPTRASNAQYTYTFAGWYTAATGGTQVTAATKMAAKDTTVYAHWTSNTRSYTVSYQTTYGTLNRTSQSIAYNSKGSCTLTMPNNTAEFTYTFVGWYTAANGGGTKVGSELTLETPAITGTVTYYAYVTRSTKSYTHTFNANGGGTVSPATITKAYNTALGTLPTVSRTGYTFVGWFDTSAASGGTQATTTTKVTGTKTWYARWSINSYTFTFNKNGGNTPSATTITKEYNTAIGTLPTCTRSADNTYTYAFAGWFDTSASSGGTQLTTSTKVTSNKTWYARWTPTYKNYTVTWNGNGGTPSKSSSSFHYNDALGTLPTATRTGYTFKGWSTSKTGTVNVNTTTKVTANVTYYAVWTINSYTWTFDANGGTGNTTKKLDYNATLSTLPTASRDSTAANNYTFAGWFDTDASTGGTQLTTSTKCTGNKTWYARWTASTRQYKLTVTAGTGGTVSGGGTYNYNASATLKATANSGYHFVKWSDGNTSATRTVTVTKNATYTATFAQDPYLNLDKTSLEFEASGGTQTVNVTSNISWTVS